MAHTRSNEEIGTAARPEMIKAATEKWYAHYYAQKGADRNSLLNPEVLFQVMAYDASVLSALRLIHPHPETDRILDVGCGDGSSLPPFLRLGFDPSNLYGIDILDERIARGKMRFPGVNLECRDASEMNFANDFFDVVFASTMFIQITDDDLSQEIADEMLRVTKPGGHVLLSDWRYSRLGSSHYKAMSQKRISRLFAAGVRTTICGIFRGELVPPVGRFLSKNLPSVYFMVQRVFPFLVGQMTTVLEKT
jgi:ubiquinone/menaquinone biosynthesis C-methylase UbiE